MSSKSPLISIGLPVYNGQRYVASAIESILNQTFNDFELIISDNASTDDTEEICSNYCLNDSRIKYYRNAKNIGSAKNFNRVFELSAGTYFRWHSADDLCDPMLLEKCKRVLDTDKSIVLCSPQTILIDEFGNLIDYLNDNLNIRDEKTKNRLEKLHLRLRLCNAQYGLMRSEIVRKTALEGDYPGSDIVFLSEMCLYGNFEQLYEHLFYRRWHENASSNLKTVQEQQYFWDPDTSGKLFLREWRHIVEHIRIVERASIRFDEKIQVITLILKWIRWNRKTLFREILLAIKHIFSYRKLYDMQN
jgi:glycosyltransferase involved in cell wall biosynthesis